jgi:COMM domain containing 7
MKLTIDRGEGLQNVYMELSLEQFYQFMVQMEKAKAYLDFVSG